MGVGDKPVNINAKIMRKDETKSGRKEIVLLSSGDGDGCCFCICFFLLKDGKFLVAAPPRIKIKDDGDDNDNEVC